MASGYFHTRAADGAAYQPNNGGSRRAHGQPRNNCPPPDHPDMFTWKPGQAPRAYEPRQPPSRPGREKSGRPRGNSWGVDEEQPPEAPDAPPANDPAGMEEWELKQARLGRWERKKLEREERRLAEERRRLADEFYVRKWKAIDEKEFRRARNHKAFQDLEGYMLDQDFLSRQQNCAAEWQGTRQELENKMRLYVADWHRWEATFNRHWYEEARRYQKRDDELHKKQEAAYHRAEKMRREEYEAEMRVKRRRREERREERRRLQQEQQQRQQRHYQQQQQRYYRERQDSYYQEEEEQYEPARPPTPVSTVDAFENFRW